MNKLSAETLNTLSLGASLLGSGGGGDTTILSGLLKHLLEEKGPIKLLTKDALQDEDLVIPLALIGAPLISLERLPTSAMFLALFKTLQQFYPERRFILMPAEIGGANALTPFILAAHTGLPVLDGDLIGRAFPKLQMSKPALLGAPLQHSFMIGPFGDTSHFISTTVNELETTARQAAIERGSSALLATFIFDGKEKENYLIESSLSRAFHLGLSLEKLKNTQDLPLEPGARYLGDFLVSTVCHELKQGFLSGFAELTSEKKTLRLSYQNEYLVVEDQEGALLAQSPDIIILLEKRTHQALSSESLRYGLKVSLYSFKAPAFWEAGRALASVNLEAFGLNLHLKKELTNA